LTLDQRLCEHRRMSETDEARRVFQAAIEATPGGRARVLSLRHVEAHDALAAQVEIDWLDRNGERLTATAQIWAPVAALTRTEPAPLRHLAGYEMPDDAVGPHVEKGFVVSNPGDRRRTSTRSASGTRSSGARTSITPSCMSRVRCPSSTPHAS
jgi:hypothetical protein